MKTILPRCQRSVEKLNLHECWWQYTFYSLVIHEFLTTHNFAFSEFKAHESDKCFFRDENHLQNIILQSICAMQAIHFLCESTTHVFHLKKVVFKESNLNTTKKCSMSFNAATLQMWKNSRQLRLVRKMLPKRLIKA